MKFRIALLAGLLANIGCNPSGPAAVEPSFDLTDGQWIDLTYDFSSETLYWPTAEPFELDTVSFGMTPAGFFYSAYAYKAAEHGGTHLDAPIHFSSGKQSVEQVPVENLVGPAVMIDLKTSVGENPDYLVTASDLQSVGND